MSRKLFEVSDNKEIKGLISSSILDIHKFDTKLHSNIYLFNSQIVYKIKGKTIDKLYKKSQLVIQVYNNKGKVEILIQLPTIQHTSQRLMVILVPLLL